MDDKNRLGMRILVVALVLGILGDTLLRGIPWGINFALWALMLVAFAAALGWRTRTFKAGGRWLLLPLLLFPITFAWRDSTSLQLLDVLALLVAFSILVLRAQGGPVLSAGLAHYLAGSVIAGLNTLFGPLILMFGEIKWREVSSGRFSGNWLAVARGALLAIPPLLVFGGLLMSADAVFESWTKELFAIDFEVLLSHTFLALFLAWIVSGYARGALVGNELSLTAGHRLPRLSLGAAETGVVLGSLNLLFLGFVIVQFRYFFGGASLVQVTPGLTYSEYARSGFFELLTVVTLVLPLLLGLHWLLRKDNPQNERLFRFLGGGQLILLGVIMASAFQRMWLYQQEYGLTEQRLYPTAFMGWLAVVFVWFALTVLRGHRERFAFGAMVAGFALIAALHLLNPDALIVRVNAARGARGREFDAYYATQLSADAVPELIAALPNLPPNERCQVAGRLVTSWTEEKLLDWRTWNYSRARAVDLVQENVETLHRMACRKMPGRD